MKNTDFMLADPRVFKAEFEKNLSRFPTYKEAYEAVENQHKRVFGKRKYSCYNSFRNSAKRFSAKIAG